MDRHESRTDGHTDGLTDGQTDSAITICLPKFLWGHKKIVFLNSNICCWYSKNMLNLMGKKILTMLKTFGYQNLRLKVTKKNESINKRYLT